MYSRSRQGQEPQHRIYPEILPCLVGTMPGDREGLGTPRNFPSPERWWLSRVGHTWAALASCCHAGVWAALHKPRRPHQPPGAPRTARGPPPPQQGGFGAAENSTEEPAGAWARLGGGGRPRASPELGVVD